jgi:hypothetical protein
MHFIIIITIFVIMACRLSITRGSCDILVQGLIELIEYSYHQGVPSFSEARTEKTSVGLRC